MQVSQTKPLGSLGHLGAYSFHETKNVISGEGGALIINDPKYTGQAEIIREKGTNRSRFFRGEVDKYTWESCGSSFLPGEIVAAFLWAQLQEAKRITENRLCVWENYHNMLAGFEQEGLLRRPYVPEDCGHNAHMYYILLDKGFDRQKVLQELKEEGIYAVFHYVPLHSAPAGQRYCRVHGSMQKTCDLSERLIRLPLWYGLPWSMQEYVVEKLGEILKRMKQC